MPRALRTILAAVLVLWGAAAAAQKPAPEPGKPSGRVALPILAIGVLQIDGRGMCTATVVAPRVVLTAAHCLFDEREQPRRSLLFRAGYENGRAAIEARGIDRVVPRGFTRKRHATTRQIDGLDWALVRLDRDVGAVTGVLGVRALSNRELDDMVAGRGSRILQVGYGRTGGRAQSALEECPLLVRWNDNTYGHNCGTVVGDSGSPNLLFENGRYVVIGVESADVNTATVQGMDMVVSASAFAAAVTQETGR